MKYLIFTCLLSFLATTQAQTIYKSVDEQGNVTYSSTSPKDNQNTEILTAPPEPSEEEVDAARQQQAELEDILKEKKEQRLLKDQQTQAQTRQSDSQVTEQHVIPYPVLGNRPNPHLKPTPLPNRPPIRPRPLPAIP